MTNNANGTRPATIQKTSAALAELLATAARPGFYGVATLTINLQDGHVQQLRMITDKQLR